MSRYSELLRDPRWQRKRLEVLQRENFQCEMCDSRTTTLNVHHRYYVAHRLPWEYPDFCYQCLCEDCHAISKESIESNRQEGLCMFDDWEHGLDYFGCGTLDAAAACNAGLIYDLELRARYRK